MQGYRHASAKEFGIFSIFAGSINDDKTRKDISGITDAASFLLLLFRYQHVLARPYQERNIRRPFTSWRRRRTRSQRVTICCNRYPFKLPVGGRRLFLWRRISAAVVILNPHRLRSTCPSERGADGLFPPRTASVLTFVYSLTTKRTFTNESGETSAENSLQEVSTPGIYGVL